MLSLSPLLFDVLVSATDGGFALDHIHRPTPTRARARRPLRTVLIKVTGRTDGQLIPKKELKGKQEFSVSRGSHSVPLLRSISANGEK